MQKLFYNEKKYFFLKYLGIYDFLKIKHQRTGGIHSKLNIYI